MDKDLVWAWKDFLGAVMTPESALAMLKRSSEVVDWNQIPSTNGSVSALDTLAVTLTIRMLNMPKADWSTLWSEVAPNLGSDTWNDVLSELFSYRRHLNKEECEIRVMMLSSMPKEALDEITNEKKSWMMHGALDQSDADTLRFIVEKINPDLEEKYGFCPNREAGCALDVFEHSYLAGVRDEVCAKTLLDAGIRTSTVHNGKNVLDALKTRRATSFNGERSRKNILALVQAAHLKNVSPEQLIEEERSLFFKDIVLAKTSADIKHAVKQVREKSNINNWKTENGWSVCQYMAYKNPGLLKELMTILKIDKAELTRESIGGMTVWKALMMSAKASDVAIESCIAAGAETQEIYKEEFWVDLMNIYLSCYEHPEITKNKTPFAAIEGGFKPIYEERYGGDYGVERLIKCVGIDGGMTQNVTNNVKLEMDWSDQKRKSFVGRSKLLAKAIYGAASKITEEQQEKLLRCAEVAEDIKIVSGFHSIAGWAKECGAKYEVPNKYSEDARKILNAVFKYASCYSIHHSNEGELKNELAELEYDLRMAYETSERFSSKEITSRLNGVCGDAWKSMLRIKRRGYHANAEDMKGQEVMKNLERIGENVLLKKAANVIGIDVRSQKNLAL